MTETLTYKQAITRAMADELAADDTVFVFGEDVGAAGGVFKATEGLFDTFGPERVLDTPISEQAIVGTAIGAAIQGLRPIAEIMFADFAAVCFDGIVNELAKYRYMTGGQVTLPVTLRMGAGGAGGGFGAQHSQAVENWFLNVAGLKLVVPATPVDAYSLLRAAIRDPDPVLFFEHKGLYNIKAEMPSDIPELALGTANVVRQGQDVSVIATQAMLQPCLDAAASVAGEGVDVEVIDPRTLIPFDMATVVSSLGRTNRLVVVQEAAHAGSWGATMVSSLVQEQFELFDAPPVIVAAEDTPIPFARSLEELWIPSTTKVVDAIRTVMSS